MGRAGEAPRVVCLAGANVRFVAGGGTGEARVVALADFGVGVEMDAA